MARAGMANPPARWRGAGPQAAQTKPAAEGARDQPREDDPAGDTDGEGSSQAIEAVGLHGALLLLAWHTTPRLVPAAAPRMPGKGTSAGTFEG